MSQKAAKRQMPTLDLVRELADRLPDFFMKKIIVFVKWSCSLGDDASLKSD